MPEHSKRHVPRLDLPKVSFNGIKREDNWGLPIDDFVGAYSMNARAVASCGCYSYIDSYRFLSPHSFKGNYRALSLCIRPEESRDEMYRYVWIRNSSYVCRAEACRLLVTTFLANFVIVCFVSSVALPWEGLFTPRTGHGLTSMMFRKRFFVYLQSVLELLKIINAQATTLFGGSSWPKVRRKFIV